MGKSTINGQFSIAMLNYQRVSIAMLVSQRDPEAFSGGKTGHTCWELGGQNLRAPGLDSGEPETSLVRVWWKHVGRDGGNLGKPCTLWKTNILRWKMAIEIVDLPIKMVIFHSYVSLPEASWKGPRWIFQHFTKAQDSSRYLLVATWWRYPMNS